MDAHPLSLGRGYRTDRAAGIGLTHVIDTGTPIEQIRGLLEMAGEHVHIWKFGFGTGFIDPTVEKKVQLLSDWGISACLGGTLLEAAWIRGNAAELLDWAADRSFPLVEVSNGAAQMSRDDKTGLIKAAAERFEVLAEVGSKDPADRVSAAEWCEEMLLDLDAGASMGIAEGRESGTVGLYGSDGMLRCEVADELVGRVGATRIIFEAPRTSQQAVLIRRFGATVNLGNIHPGDVLALEALRRGLRADTLRQVGPNPQ